MLRQRLLEYSIGAIFGLYRGSIGAILGIVFYVGALQGECWGLYWSYTRVILRFKISYIGVALGTIGVCIGVV